MIAERVDTLVIARLATSPHPMSSGALGRALLTFAPAAETAAAQARISGLALDAELAARLGKHSWRTLVDSVLPSQALGARPTDADRWIAAVAGRILGLWTEGKPPSLAEVADACVWRELGISGRAKRCPRELRSALLARVLNVPGTDPRRQLRLYVARELAVPRPALALVRTALVRRWLAGAVLGRNFGEDLQRAVRETTNGAFGSRKVFIASVLEQLKRDPCWAASSAEVLKAKLLGEHRAGRVELARADLVGAMDPQLVAASEARADGASFHFVVREER